MLELSITGLGVVSPTGVGGYSEFVRALRETERRFGPSEVLDHEKIGNSNVAEVRELDVAEHLGKKGHRNLDRLTKFLLIAARKAMVDAGLKSDGEHTGYGPTDVGVCSSTAYGSLETITELNLVAELEDPRYINPSKFPNTVINAAAGYVSIWEDLRAPNVTVVDGNCGSLDVVLTAATHLQNRRAKAFLIGGGEALSEALFLAFKKLGLLELAGNEILMGEGAAYLVAEPTELYLHRAGSNATGAAKELARIVGYGTAFSPPESDALLVNASSKPVRRAMEKALADADISASDVDVIAASYSGVRELDRAESEAIKDVFGESTAVAAPKRFFGESFGAAGAFGLASATAWCCGEAPELVSGSCDSPRTVLVNAVGYYGNATSVVVRHAP